MAHDLPLARRLADAAKDTWLEVRHRDDLHQDVGMGADGTPTTRVDRWLDDAILAVAGDHGVTVISEETGRTDPPDGPSSVLAYVDPLDGSRNAGRGIPFFCVSIGLADPDTAGLPGVHTAHVQNLVTQDRYETVRGQGHVTCNDAVCRRPAFDPEEVLVALIADSSVDDVQLEQERRGHHIRDLGSAALELSLVATGGLDAFLVRKPWLRNIDVAAGLLLVQESGGAVEAPGGGAIDLREDVRHRLGLLAAGGPTAMEAVR